MGWKWRWIGLAVFLGGCGQVSQEQASAETVVSDTTHAEISQPSPPQTDSVTVLPFVLAEWDKTVDWGGKLKDGARWNDKTGSYVLLISDLFRGEISDVSLVARVNARKYRMAGDSLQLVWEVKEVNQDYFTNPEYRFKTLEITDLDRDGIAETSFIYTIDSDGGGPCRAKLILHVNDQKYAIRGQFAGMDIDVGEIEEKHIGPEFSSVDPRFKAFASQKWDDFEREFYDSWKGE